MKESPRIEVSAGPRLGVLVIVACAMLLPSSLFGQWTSGTGLIYYNGGKVGIGTSTPTAKLHLLGGSTASALNIGNTSHGLALTSDTAGYNRIYMEQLASASGKRVFFLENGGGALSFKSVSDDATSFVNDRILQLTSAGNIGIGVLSPAAKLHVYGGSTASGLSLTNTGHGLLLTSDTANYNRLYFEQLSATSGQRVFAVDNSAGVLSFKSMNDGASAYVSNNILNLTSAGNVGIGIASPQYKLAVNGTIGAKEVIVTSTGWADYVFRSDYPLKPLKEVASYVKENGHLPEIPSSFEVQENGISLGEMQAKLLSKIEELTLHMIQAEEKNNLLQQRIGQLEEALDKRR